MIIIPAIDLEGGRCVRLVEGKLGTERVVARDPVAQALAFEESGAERLHVVDLDGAFTGSPVPGTAPANRSIIEAILRAVHLPVEVGGGLREEADVDRLLDAGAAYAILGTMVVRDPDRFARICAAHPGRIIAGIDVRAGQIAVEGWVTTVELEPAAIARAAEAMGAAAVITTNVARDGTGKGADAEGTDALARSVSIPVIASGGVAGIEDIVRLRATKAAGVVVGRAIYDGALDLAEAIRAAR